ncbi:hypothetical protein L345_07806, partial [Ophiophagus hannah]
MYAAAYITTKKLGLKIQKNQRGKKGKPKWKIRNLKQGQLKNKQIKSSLAARYHLENKEIAVVIEELKQREQKGCCKY